MFQKIKIKLHNIFFKSQTKRILSLEIALEKLAKNNISMKDEYESRVKHIEELAQKKIDIQPTLADMMRDNLGLITVDFTHQEAGVPKHFLDLPDTLNDREKRKMYIAQLAQIQQLDVWPVLMQNLIDTQGNYMLRVGLTDMDIFAGRFQISGISLVKDEVKNGFDEYMEGSKPKDDFDPTDNSTEGIPYQKDEEEIIS